MPPCKPFVFLIVSSRLGFGVRHSRLVSSGKGQRDAIQQRPQAASFRPFESAVWAADTAYGIDGRLLRFTLCQPEAQQQTIEAARKEGHLIGEGLPELSSWKIT
ncbi:hypothetical protein F4861DRAFT_503849 [Xylaria intraflava]|nr:hypothetical protein F4861DRAFT_503849 [Xylaria intraflava]